MSSIGTGYDLSASQFSPDGRVFQVEYAQKAVEYSGTAIALRGKDCVVFAVEKIVHSKLYEPGTNSRLFTVDRHVGMATAGLLPDARQVGETAKSEAATYRNQNGVPIPIKTLIDRVSMFIHAHTLYSYLRPFGCSMILGTYDEVEGPGLYLIETSGISNGYFGCAVGKARQTAKTEIEKLKLDELTPEALVKEAAKIIYLVHDELKDKNFELELSWVGKNTNGVHQRVPKELADEVNSAAKSAMEEESDTDQEDS